MTSRLKALCLQIDQGQLLGEDFFAFDPDSALDKRDSAPFDTPWTQTYAKVQDAWKLQSPDKQAEKLVNELQRMTFLKASRATMQHDIASYISDDFELIGKYLHLELDLPFAQRLLDAYTSHRMPGAEVTETPSADEP